MHLYQWGYLCMSSFDQGMQGGIDGMSYRILRVPFFAYGHRGD